MNNAEFLLHERCRRILTAEYPDASPFDIVECCNEWIAKGHKIPAGVVKYFKAYYQ